MIDGSALVAVIDQRVALSARMYDRSFGRIALCVCDGEVRTVEFRVTSRL
jgi:hypothetical protein